MAIRLPKPKKAQSLPPIEPNFDNVHQVDEIIATEVGTSFVTLTEMHEGFNNLELTHYLNSTKHDSPS